MFWNLTFLAALGVGNYFGPAYLGMPINIYSSDPQARIERLMIDSENLRQLHEEWRQFWINEERRRLREKDPPSDKTPYRIHGGVGPASSEI
jgi:hypothetical protein